MKLQVTPELWSIAKKDDVTENKSTIRQNTTITATRKVTVANKSL